MAANGKLYDLAVSAMDNIRKQRGMTARIAKELKISTQAISNWDVVPIKRVPEVSKLIKVSRERLRPDIFLNR